MAKDAAKARKTEPPAEPKPEAEHKPARPLRAGGSDRTWAGEPVRPARAREGVDRMIVGVPREIKADEYRVAMLPVGAEELTGAGNRVLVEAGAGQGSGIADAQYAAAGAT